MIIRELIALFGAKINKTDFAEVEREIQGRMFRLNTAIGGALGGFLTYQAAQWAQSSAGFEDSRRIMEASGQSLDSLREKTKGLFTDSSLVTNFNKAQQFGLGASFAKMTEIADAAGTLLNESQDYMLSRLTTGLAKESPMRLDELGILIKQDELYKKYAATFEGVGSKFTSMQKRQALTLEVMRQGQMIIDQVQASGGSTRNTYDRMAAAMDGAKLAVGKMADSLLQALAPSIQAVLNRVRAFSENKEAIQWFEDFGEAMKTIGSLLRPFLFLLGQAFSLLSKIPGAGYILATVLGVYVAGAMAGVIAKLYVLIPALAALKAAAVGGMWAQLGMVASLESWYYTMIPLVGTVLAVAAALTILAMGLEEAFAFFDDTKLGFLEEYLDDMGKLGDVLRVRPTDGGWLAFFKNLLGLLSSVAVAIDTVISEMIIAGIGGVNIAGALAMPGTMAERSARAKVEADKALEIGGDKLTQSKDFFNGLTGGDLSTEKNKSYQEPSRFSWNPAMLTGGMMLSPAETNFRGLAARHQETHITINAQTSATAEEIGREVRRELDNQNRDAGDHSNMPGREDAGTP